MLSIEQRLLALEARQRRRGLRCGARTQKGTPCRMKPVSERKGRCRLHGGLSTGPKTAEGRARIAEAQRRRWAKWRAHRGEGDGGST
jgi:hypothetical protein